MNIIANVHYQNPFQLRQAQKIPITFKLAQPMNPFTYVWYTVQT